jgi:hypothetical protein
VVYQLDKRHLVVHRQPNEEQKARNIGSLIRRFEASDFLAFPDFDCDGTHGRSVGRGPFELTPIKACNHTDW